MSPPQSTTNPPREAPGRPSSHWAKHFRTRSASITRINFAQDVDDSLVGISVSDCGTVSTQQLQHASETALGLDLPRSPPASSPPTDHHQEAHRIADALQMELSTPTDSEYDQGGSTNSNDISRFSKPVALNPQSHGTLAKLPPEVRNIVWKQLMPEHRQGASTRPPYTRDSIGPSKNLIWHPCELAHLQARQRLYGDSLAILRASQHLYQEVAAELYNTTLHCYIHPSEDAWIARDLKGEKLGPFERFDSDNLSRFRKIRIGIYPPTHNDPGELLKIRKYVKDFVSALREAPTLPAIEIILVENDSTTWFSNKIKRNRIHRCVPNIEGGYDDLELLIMPFQYLRKVRHVKIDLPTRARYETYYKKFVEEIQTAMISTKAFGTEESDDSFDSEERTNDILLDVELDTLGGKTAAHLRVERFENFFEYAREMKKLLYYESEKHDLFGEHEDSVYYDFRMRCRAYLTWDPNSRLLYKHISYDSDDDEVVSSFAGRYWNGIPPKLSPEWNHHMQKYKLEEKEYEDFMIDHIWRL